MKKKTNWALFIFRCVMSIALLLSMIAQFSHGVKLFSLIDKTDPYIVFYGWCFAVGYDLSTGLFIWKGLKRQSFIAAAGLVLINLLMYSIINQLIDVRYSVIMAVILVSILMPAIIYSYSTMIHDEKEAEDLALEHERYQIYQDQELKKKELELHEKELELEREKVSAENLIGSNKLLNVLKSQIKGT